MTRTPDGHRTLFTRAACAAVAAVGLLVLAGWALGRPALTTVVPGSGSMKANAAVAFVAAAAGLWLVAGNRPGRRGRALAAFAGLVGLITLAEYLTGADLGVDELLVRDPDAGPPSIPGRMSPVAAAGFVLLAAALLLLDAGSRLVRAAAQPLALVVAFAGLLAVLGYLYDAEGFYRVGPYTAVAAPAAAALILLALGVLSARPDRGVVGLLTSPSLGGLVARRQLGVAVVFLVAAGWLRVAGQNAGWFDTETGTALLVAAAVAVFGVLIVHTARTVHALDGRRRQADRRVAASEARKAAVLDTALDGIITIDHAGNVVDFNPAAERTFGYRRADVVGREMAALIVPPALRAAHRDGMARYLATGEGPVLNRRLELTAVRADGTEFPVELAITPIPGDGPPLFTGHLRDITERRRLEQRAAERLQAARLLAAVVESSDDAVISKSLDGVIQTWNAAAERLFGYTAAEAVGRSVLLLIPADRADEEDRILARLRAGERVEHFDTVRVRADGRQVPVSLTVSPVRDEAGLVVGASKIVRDVTERKRMEDELRQFAASLSDADRRKTEFMAMLAHELRNPLAPIRTAVEVIARAAHDPDVVRRSFEMVGRQVNQMVRLVDDLLDVSRVSRGKVELRRGRVELAAVVSHAAEAARPLCAAKGHDLVVALPAEPVAVDGDPARLAQVVGNLLTNAAKFTDPGGRVEVAAGREGGDAVVRVRDTGIGIPADQLPRVFDLFTQLDTSLERTQSGLGIGLTLVKHLVELHGGTVEANSAGPGQGTECVVRLPALTEPAPAPPPEPIDGPAVPRRILVVDDNRDAADSLAVLLRLSGHEVHAAHDGEAAVRAAAAVRPDVVLLDIGLPKLNGYEAARRIRAEPGGDAVLLVALTGWGQDEDKARSAAAGFDHHLTKPVDFTALLRLLAGAGAVF